MNLLIIGTGAVASVLAKHAILDKEIKKIFCLGPDTTNAKQFLPVHRKINIVKGDASCINQMLPYAKRSQIIVNASLPRFNITIMQAALQSNARYLDLASELADLKNPEQLALHKAFQKNNNLALINAGVAPGVTNLLARDLSEKFSSLDAINIRCLERQISDAFYLSWSLETTLDDSTAPPLIYTNNRFRLTKPFSDPETVKFPSPLGDCVTYNIYGDEVATLPKYIKVKSVDFKSGGTDIETAKILYNLGILRRKPFKINGRSVAPIDLMKILSPHVPSPTRMKQLIKEKIIKNANFALNITAVGYISHKKTSKTISVIFPDLKQIQQLHPGATYISYPTGTAAYCFLKQLSSIKQTGVIPPEALEKQDRQSIISSLKSHKIRFQTTA